MSEGNFHRAPISGASDHVEGRLYLLLAKAFPAWRTSIGALDVKRIAEGLGSSREGVYRWLRTDRIPPQRAKQLIVLSDRRLTERDFLPYLFWD